MMRSSWMGLAVLATAACVRAVPGPEAPAAEASLMEHNRRYDAALLANDVAALEALYAEDFMYIGPAGEVRTRAEQIAAAVGTQLAEGTSEDVVVRGTGGVAVVTGRFRGVELVAGERRPFVERYTTVWRRTSTGWVLEHEHSSMEPAGTAAGQGGR